ncbi:MAG: hypothetical protein NC548_05530 [Lachnospiraceae bacterium]|nr:hypothetical protein [Lachnospiraceae bacterium]
MGKNIETMNLHDALVELKTLGKRIETEINNMKICGVASVSKLNSDEIVNFKTSARATLCSVADLRRRRFAIKAAVVQANATTFVEINGRRYSIAEIIEMRKAYISELESIQAKIANAYNAAKKKVDDGHAKAVADALKNLSAKSETALTEEQVKAYKSLVDLNDVTMVEPEGVDLQKMLKEIADTLDGYNRLDSLLSTKNATTNITVEYDTGALFSETLTIVADPDKSGSGPADGPISEATAE